VLLEKHGGLFESMIARIGREHVLENLCVIYQELEPSNFGRIMAYLTLVFKVSDFCEPEIVQEAEKICVWELRVIPCQFIHKFLKMTPHLLDFIQIWRK
jgi:hypothetical protein